jgi:hypothetical protein
VDGGFAAVTALVLGRHTSAVNPATVLRALTAGTRFCAPSGPVRPTGGHLHDAMRLMSPEDRPI